MAMKFGDVFNSSDFNINNPKLEEVLNKTKDVAESFGKKSAERLEISRKKIALLDVKTKLSKLYESYGKNQYRAHMGEAVDESELESQVAEISELEEKYLELTAEIEIAKAEFGESFINMAQKTKDAFHHEEDSEDVNIDPYDLFETEDEE